MIDIKKYTPYPDLPIFVKTRYGNIRKAELNSLFGAYHLTDNTHPMANIHLSYYDIISWKYCDDRNMQQCLFIENKFQRQKDAEEILLKVKLTWTDKLKFKTIYWLKDFKRHLYTTWDKRKIK